MYRIGITLMAFSLLIQAEVFILRYMVGVC
jgi:hypothetical protein